MNLLSVTALKPKLVIFDVDNTLFGSALSQMRPHTRSTLRKLSEHFELALWTRSPRSRAVDAATRIGLGIKWKFIWGIDECYEFQYKSLRKVTERFSMDKDTILLVDDAEEHAKFNLAGDYHTYVIEPYYGDVDQKTDRALKVLRDALLRMQLIATTITTTATTPS